MADDLVLKVRQISQYPGVEYVNPDDSVLIQQNGIGGPYVYAPAATLVSNAMGASNGTFYVNTDVSGGGGGIACNGPIVAAGVDAGGNSIITTGDVVVGNGLVAQSLYDFGSAAIGSWMTVGGFLNVDGGDLNVTGGNANVSGNISAGGNLGVSGAAIVGSLGVAGAATINGLLTAAAHLNVTCGIDLAGNQTISGNLAIGGELDVAGAAAFSGDLDIGGNESLLGNLSMNGNLSVVGTAVIGGDVNLCSQLEVNDAALFDRGIYVTGGQTVCGNSSLSGDLTVGDNLCVNGYAGFEGDLGVLGDADVLGDLDVSGTISAGGTQVATIDFVDCGLCALGADMLNALNSAIMETSAELNAAIDWAKLDVLFQVEGTYAPLNSPDFTGMPTAPTPEPGSNDAKIATTAFVQNATAAATAGVATWNDRSGHVRLELTDIVDAGGAPLNAPHFSGLPESTDAAPGTDSNVIATTHWVNEAIAASRATSVLSWNNRVGDVELLIDDILAAGGAPIRTPTFLGSAHAPTPEQTSSDTNVATTAFVQNLLQSAVTDETSRVQKEFKKLWARYNHHTVWRFNQRTGDVVFRASDLSAVGGAFLDSPNFIGVPTAPTAPPQTDTNQLATTAYVDAAIASNPGPPGPAGPQGNVGPAGQGFKIIGTVDTFGDLPMTDNLVGDVWLADDTGDGWVWDGTRWKSIGHIRGAVGPVGPAGPMASANLAPPTPNVGNPGDMWWDTVNHLLYVCVNAAPQAAWELVTMNYLQLAGGYMIGNIYGAPGGTLVGAIKWLPGDDYGPGGMILGTGVGPNNYVTLDADSIYTSGQLYAMNGINLPTPLRFWDGENYTYDNYSMSYSSDDGGWLTFDVPNVWFPNGTVEVDNNLTTNSLQVNGEANFANQITIGGPDGSDVDIWSEEGWLTFNSGWAKGELYVEGGGSINGYMRMRGMFQFYQGARMFVAGTGTEQGPGIEWDYVSGQMRFSYLPTSDPGVADAVWNSNGQVVLSGYTGAGVYLPLTGGNLTGQLYVQSGNYQYTLGPNYLFVYNPAGAGQICVQGATAYSTFGMSAGGIFQFTQSGTTQGYSFDRSVSVPGMVVSGQLQIASGGSLLNYGDMSVNTATITTIQSYGNVTLNSIPTANPNIAGRVWNNGGQLMISSGP